MLAALTHVATAPMFTSRAFFLTAADTFATTDAPYVMASMWEWDLISFRSPTS
jgi:hypothetical protein